MTAKKPKRYSESEVVDIVRAAMEVGRLVVDDWSQYERHTYEFAMRRLHDPHAWVEAA